MAEITGTTGDDTIWGTDGNDVLIGLAGVDWIRARGGDDFLFGGDDNDNLLGGDGNDLLSGGNGRDVALYWDTDAGVTINLGLTSAQNTGGSGIDTLLSIENISASSYNDTLIGNGADNGLGGEGGDDLLYGMDGNDTLSGGDDNDTLTGGAGSDTLSGDYPYNSSINLGNDIFDYNAVSDSLPGFLNRDVITDFIGRGRGTFVGDRIDLSTIDANVSVSGNQAFSWIGGAAFTAAGQLRYNTTTGILQGSTDGDTAAEFEIELVGAPALSVGGLGTDILL